MGDRAIKLFASFVYEMCVCDLMPCVESLPEREFIFSLLKRLVFSYMLASVGILKHHVLKLNFIIFSLCKCQLLLDRPFHNFRASRSGDWRILWSSGTSCGGFWISKVVKVSVGWSHQRFIYRELRQNYRTAESTNRFEIVPGKKSAQKNPKAACSILYGGILQEKILHSHYFPM